MLIAAIFLGVVGYALLYAGWKGDGAAIKGVPLWRAPWLPFVAAFNADTQTV